MQKIRYYILGFLCLCFVVSGCDGYNKILKSNDIDLKFSKAKEYYHKGNYYKAIPLFDELIAIYRGQPELQEIYYMYCFAHYGQGNYVISGYNFKNYYSYYPNSEHAEEAMFMVAKSHVELSPEVELDQTYTEKAVDALQLYINSYPESERLAEANNLIESLWAKMEHKAFYAAKLYFDMSSYRASASAFSNILNDFPDIEDADEIHYYIIKSQYFFAKNSIERKQKERYTAVITAFNHMNERYPMSKFMKEASGYNDNAKSFLANN